MQLSYEELKYNKDFRNINKNNGEIIKVTNFTYIFYDKKHTFIKK